MVTDDETCIYVHSAIMVTVSEPWHKVFEMKTWYSTSPTLRYHVPLSGTVTVALVRYIYGFPFPDMSVKEWVDVVCAANQYEMMDAIEDLCPSDTPLSRLVAWYQRDKSQVALSRVVTHAMNLMATPNMDGKDQFTAFVGCDIQPFLSAMPADEACVFELLCFAVDPTNGDFDELLKKAHTVFCSPARKFWVRHRLIAAMRATTDYRFVLIADMMETSKQ